MKSGMSPNVVGMIARQGMTAALGLTHVMTSLLYDVHRSLDLRGGRWHANHYRSRGVLRPGNAGRAR